MRLAVGDRIGIYEVVGALAPAVWRDLSARDVRLRATWR